MEKLHILTRCTRPHNLLKIKESLIYANSFELTWHIIFDVNVLKDIDVELLSLLESDDYCIDFKFLGSLKNAYGYDSINKIVNFISNNEWIYLLDDDNLLHEDFNELNIIIENNSNKSIIVFDQYVGGKDFSGLEYRKASIENTHVGGIDAAQYIIKRQMLVYPTGMPYSLNYCADGILMNFLLAAYNDEFLFFNKTYCYYNSIHNIVKSFSLPRVLLIGTESEVKLESNQVVDYESKDLNTLQINDDSKLDSVLQQYNPDVIITVGTDHTKFSKLSSKSSFFRKRWLHFDEIDNNTGEFAYQCASNYIFKSYDEETPLVSFFTPIFNIGDKLLRTFESVKNQSYNNWEWVIVNDSNDNGKTLKIAESIALTDCRVKVYDFREKSGGIVGESKYRAACLSKGKYIMELDHDDYITEDAAELMVRAFKEYPDCKFVYSDCAEIYEDHSCIVYQGAAFGYFSYRKVDYNGRTYDVANTSNINPKTIRHIVGVPNHFRAWDRLFYLSIGGHNRRLTIADDYELIVRTFLKTRMVRIPKLLYLQYYHNSNTQNMTRADIQRRVKSIRYYYNEMIHERFLELGVQDWAYDFNSQDPLWAPSLFGQEENFVNYTMIL